jgi:hypothetical protein
MASELLDTRGSRHPTMGSCQVAVARRWPQAVFSS